MSFQEFIDMGGYAPYIWSSYGIALVIFVALFISVKMQRKSLIDKLRRRYKLEAQRQKKTSLEK